MCKRLVFFSHDCLPRASPAAEPLAVDFAGIDLNENQGSLKASLALGPPVKVTVMALAFYDDFERPPGGVTRRRQ
jgi:hypothetical protein